MGEPQLQADLSELGELRWRIVSRYRQVTAGRSQVLAQSEDVYIAPAKVAHAHDNLIPLLTHAQDDSRLREPAGLHSPGVGQELEGTPVASARSGQPVQPLGSLQI